MPHLEDDPGLHPRRALLAPGSWPQRQGLPEVPEVATKGFMLGPPRRPQGPLTKREEDVSRCPVIPEGMPAQFHSHRSQHALSPKDGGMQGGLTQCGLYKRRLDCSGHSDEELGQLTEEPDVEPSSLRQYPAEVRQ